MNATLLGAGLACVIGAIVEGGLKAFGIEVPLLQSRKRQLLLGAFGVISLLATYAFGETPSPSNTAYDHQTTVPEPKIEKPVTQEKKTSAPINSPNAIYQAYQLGQIVGWLSFYQTENSYAGSPPSDFQHQLAGKQALLLTILNQLEIQTDGTKLDFVGISGASYDFRKGRIAR